MFVKISSILLICFIAYFTHTGQVNSQNTSFPLEDTNSTTSADSVNFSTKIKVSDAAIGNTLNSTDLSSNTVNNSDAEKNENKSSTISTSDTASNASESTTEVDPIEVGCDLYMDDYILEVEKMWARRELVREEFQNMGVKPHLDKGNFTKLHTELNKLENKIEWYLNCIEVTELHSMLYWRKFIRKFIIDRTYSIRDRLMDLGDEFYEEGLKQNKDMLKQIDLFQRLRYQTNKLKRMERLMNIRQLFDDNY